MTATATESLPSSSPLSPPSFSPPPSTTTSPKRDISALHYFHAVGHLTKLRPSSASRRQRLATWATGRPQQGPEQSPANKRAPRSPRSPKPKSPSSPRSPPRFYSPPRSTEAEVGPALNTPAHFWSSPGALLRRRIRKNISLFKKQLTKMSTMRITIEKQEFSVSKRLEELRRVIRNTLDPAAGLAATRHVCFLLAHSVCLICPARPLALPFLKFGFRR